VGEESREERSVNRRGKKKAKRKNAGETVAAAGKGKREKKQVGGGAARGVGRGGRGGGGPKMDCRGKRREGIFEKKGPKMLIASLKKEEQYSTTKRGKEKELGRKKKKDN